MLRALLPLVRRDRLHLERQPAGAVAGDARVADRAARRRRASADVEPDPHRALAQARDLAGPEGAVLATGSIYLVADLLAPARRHAAALDAVNDDGPSVAGDDRGRRGRSSRS